MPLPAVRPALTAKAPRLQLSLALLPGSARFDGIFQGEDRGPRSHVPLPWHLEAAPADVLDAWIESDTARNWLFTAENAETLCELEPRSSGSYKITRIGNGQRYVAVGEYHLADPPDRLSVTFGMPRFAPDLDTITVEFALVGVGMQLSFTQSGLRPGYGEAAPAGRRGFSARWSRYSPVAPLSCRRLRQQHSAAAGAGPVGSSRNPSPRNPAAVCRSRLTEDPSLTRGAPNAKPAADEGANLPRVSGSVPTRGGTL